MESVQIKVEARLRYASRSKQLRAEESPQHEVAFTVARGAECDYPDILQAYDAVVAYAAGAGRDLGAIPCETYLTDLDSEVPQMEVAFPLF